MDIIAKLKFIKQLIVNNTIPSIVTEGTGGTISARYCYSVYMRHLITAHNYGLTKIPNKVAEFGPGDSIGTGLCAMLCGADEYYSLDFVNYANSERNLKIFNELIEMFKQKTPIPGDDEFPRINPKLQNYAFPSSFITDDVLNKSLDESRLERIKNIITSNLMNSKEKIVYIAPWNESNIYLTDVDFIISQAVLEHVDELESVYTFFSKILSPNGYMAHVIDFKSHKIAPKWNGHWAYSEKLYRLYKGKLPYLLNRQPLSVHEGFLKKNGFNIIHIDKTYTTENSITRNQLKHPFKDMPEEDFTVSGVYILCSTKTSPFIYK